MFQFLFEMKLVVGESLTHSTPPLTARKPFTTLYSSRQYKQITEAQKSPELFLPLSSHIYWVKADSRLESMLSLSEDTWAPLHIYQCNAVWI